MARSSVTLADVDQAEASLRAAKAGTDPAGHKAQAAETASIRRAYREQEAAAGRRQGMVAAGGEE